MLFESGERYVIDIVNEIIGYEYAKRIIVDAGYDIELEERSDGPGSFFIYAKRQEECVCMLSTVDELKAYAFGLDEGLNKPDQTYTT